MARTSARTHAATFPVLTATHPERLTNFLTAALGFIPGTFDRNGADALVTARLDWPDGGSVLLIGAGTDEQWQREPGTAGVHLSSRDVDAAFERARLAGADLISDLRTTTSGPREFMARDPEGNLWSVAAYAAEPRTKAHQDTPDERDEDARRAQVSEFMTHWAHAIVSNDAEQIDAYTTVDWALVDRGGVITRQAFHEVVASGALRHSSMSHEVLAIREIGDALLVLTHGRNTASFHGQQVEADEWTTDVLVGHGGGWRCAFTQLTPRAAPGPPPQQGETP